MYNKVFFFIFFSGPLCMWASTPQACMHLHRWCTMELQWWWAQFEYINLYLNKVLHFKWKTWGQSRLSSAFVNTNMVYFIVFKTFCETWCICTVFIESSLWVTQGFIVVRLHSDFFFPWKCVWADQITSGLCKNKRGESTQDRRRTFSGLISMEAFRERSETPESFSFTKRVLEAQPAPSYVTLQKAQGLMQIFLSKQQKKRLVWFNLKIKWLKKKHKSCFSAINIQSFCSNIFKIAGMALNCFTNMLYWGPPVHNCKDHIVYTTTKRMEKKSP